MGRNSLRLTEGFVPITLTCKTTVPQRSRLRASPHIIYAWVFSLLTVLGPDFPWKTPHCWVFIKIPSQPTVLPLPRYPVNSQKRCSFQLLPSIPTAKHLRVTGLVPSQLGSKGKALLHFPSLFPSHKTHLISLTEPWHATSLPSSKCCSNPRTKAWQSEDCLRS